MKPEPNDGERLPLPREGWFALAVLGWVITLYVIATAMGLAPWSPWK